ncbi:barstar family protein [Acetatifactor muris]|uniref:barstar family protein n=1 Tax=Acetatifactor muris TaxID=879566 RepID=UPI0023F1CAD4|nr:barstar family protein [Acetatifactor muris]
MYLCVIDGEKITDREMLHEILAEGLKLPEWYGGNLDALYDCLTEMREEAEIQVRHESVLEAHLGGYARTLRKVLSSAAEENSGISCRFE